jgi:hypothetical protein
LHLEQQILGNNLQQALPAALQQAGINLALVQQYIPTVIAALVPLLAQRIVASRRQAGITMFVAEGTALAAQIMGNDPNGFTSAARPVPEPLRTAMNPVAPQQFAPAPPAHFVPQVPQAQPAMQPPIAPPNITQQPPAPVFAGDPPTLLE